jgi:hypothetical protein
MTVKLLAGLWILAAAGDLAGQARLECSRALARDGITKPV